MNYKTVNIALSFVILTACCLTAAKEKKSRERKKKNIPKTRAEILKTGNCENIYS